MGQEGRRMAGGLRLGVASCHVLSDNQLTECNTPVVRLLWQMSMAAGCCAAAVGSASYRAAEPFSHMPASQSSAHRGMSREMTSSSTATMMRANMSASPGPPALAAATSSLKNPGQAAGYSIFTRATRACASLLRKNGGSGAVSLVASRCNHVNNAPLICTVHGSMFHVAAQALHVCFSVPACLPACVYAVHMAGHRARRQGASLQGTWG